MTPDQILEKLHKHFGGISLHPEFGELHDCPGHSVLAFGSFCKLNDFEFEDYTEECDDGSFSYFARAEKFQITYNSKGIFTVSERGEMY